MSAKVYPGLVHFRITVLERDRTRKNWYWWIQCECGTTKSVNGDAIVKGKLKSCGCWKKEYDKNKPSYTLKHGKAKDPTYKSWNGMVQRCKPESKTAKYYYEKGIKICDRWLGEEGYNNFEKDMGIRPKGKTIERVDNEGNYEPGNCVWATMKEQSLNKSNTIFMTVNDITLPKTLWEEIFNISRSGLSYRLRSGYTDEEAVYTPFIRSGKKTRVPILSGDVEY